MKYEIVLLVALIACVSAQKPGKRDAFLEQVR